VRVDVVTVFPAYLDALGLSLPGKAQRAGILDLHVHDLRDWTHDRHRTVDDTPAGGGPGMVMRPEPWGEALDALDLDGATLVVPTPAGEPFTQATARELATRERLVVACGRYEGIDQRVVDHARTRTEVREVSLGDYVLNGGEVAALAVLEAVVRLLPGVVGNPDSLTDESHEAGLLEAPVYTKPPTWRGLDVPAVLLSGDHGKVAAWRRAAATRRTAARRPDLLHASAVLAHGGEEWRVVPAAPADAPELLTLQRACWVTEAVANGDLAIPALHEELGDVEQGMRDWTTYVVRVGGRLVGSVRGRLDDDGAWSIGRLMVAPDLRGRGLGRVLLEHAEAVAHPDATAYRLVTGKDSEANLRRYRRAGYRVVEVLDDFPSGPAVLAKPRRR
jgi:tRNA (guanine37-N1)-methyltransferase